MNIVLCCAMGMSTSVVVQAMKKEAEKLGEKHLIWAIDADSLTDEDERIDVILIGPQVSFKLSEVKEDFPDTPVAVMNKLDYGNCNGGAILQFAKELYQNCYK